MLHKESEGWLNCGMLAISAVHWDIFNERTICEHDYKPHASAIKKGKDFKWPTCNYYVSFLVWFCSLMISGVKLFEAEVALF